MRIHQLSPLDAVASLKSTATGLSRDEAERRLQEFGLNEVEKVARSPLWLRVVREFTTFFSLILWVAAGLAFFAEWSDPGHDMAKVGYAIVIVIVVSGLPRGDGVHAPDVVAWYLFDTGEPHDSRRGAGDRSGNRCGESAASTASGWPEQC